LTTYLYLLLTSLQCKEMPTIKHVFDHRLCASGFVKNFSLFLWIKA